MTLVVSRRTLMAGTAALAAAAMLPTRGARAAAAKLILQSSWTNDAEFIGNYIALDNGYYTDAGVKVDYLPGGSNIIPESSLISGAADVALTSPDTTISSNLQSGSDLVIIGAVYQKSPLGIVSLKKEDITSPADLVGKTVAVPDVNRIAFKAMLQINHIDPSSVKVVPYNYDPTPLIKGEVDATLDFVTDVPYTIQEQGQETNSFTLYDAGYKIPNDTIVVTKETLAKDGPALKAFLAGSAKGWTEDFVDTKAYPAKFADSWFKGNGRTIANEEYFNAAQQPLIENPTGKILEMTPQEVSDTISTLKLIGIDATPDMFDMSLFS